MFKYICILMVMLLSIYSDQNTIDLKPGKAHQELNSIVGYWKATATVYDQDGNILLQEQGYSHNNWILGDRFVLNRHIFPSYQSVGVFGYENENQKYISAFFDNRGGQIHFSSGKDFTVEKNSRYLSLKREIKSVTGKKIHVTHQIKFSDANSYIFEVFHEKDNHIEPVLNIVYKKVDAETAQKYFPKEIHQAPADYLKDDNASYPTIYHRKLNAINGMWKTTSEAYDESGNLVKIYEGTSNNNWISGKSFMSLRIKMQDYEARGLMGYDISTKRYILAYIDNRSTGIQKSEGIALGSNFITYGNTVDYIMGKPKNLLHTIQVVDKKSFILTMFKYKDLKELNIKTLKVKFARK